LNLIPLLKSTQELKMKIYPNDAAVLAYAR